MAKVGVLFLLLIVTTGVTVQGASLKCRQCHDVRHPSECTKFVHCHDSCITRVRKSNHGEYLFTYDCVQQHICSAPHTGVCRQCCYATNCDQTTCSQYFKSALTHAPKPTTVRTTTITTTQKPSTSSPTQKTESTTTTTTLATTTEQIVSKGCNNLNVLESLAKGVSVSHPGTQPCPDGTHQPSEALIQEYCGAPSVTQWASGVNVMKNCPRIPRYAAIAASTATFGGSTVAGVFLQCEPNGFQVVMQTCGTELGLRHISTNSTTTAIPSADKFVVIHW
ncbi:uncharacterized protein LOC132730541 [Ruditapes philippinarum]|uniref:uncharacterized protein LOC132730541 n=1 Tax=Ruditapes philippinarum TaxID=129788 RepID=UPI00295A602A|nr:uncharacterized protein LOC132730541 [Ruditapes philippinarum]